MPAATNALNIKKIRHGSLKDLWQKALVKLDFAHFWPSLRYALYIPTRPFDGMWDLTHEKRGNMSAAICILLISFVVDVLGYTAVSPRLIMIYWPMFNVFICFLRTVVPILLWTMVNWATTTLMDGKGHAPDIFICMCYALVPMVIINALLIPLTHVFAYQEMVIYYMIYVLGLIWTVFLIFAAMVQVHAYTGFKALLSSLLTLLGIGIVVFIVIVLFSVVSQAISYLYAIYMELYLWLA